VRAPSDHVGDPVTIALAGDVMLGRGVDLAFKAKGVVYPWGDTLPCLRSADAAIINLECVIAKAGRPWNRWPKPFLFRADPLAVDSLERTGIDCVTLANNHTLDYGSDGLLEMLDSLEAHRIAYAGAGKNLTEARRPAILDVKGVRVGVVAFSNHEPGWMADENVPGINWVPISFRKEESIEPVQQAIAAARDQGAELVIFTIHCGASMQERPGEDFRAFARMVISLGADVCLGHSAHVFHGIELWGGNPIIYDAGDFIDDYAPDPRLRNDWGLLFRLTVEDRKVQRIQFLPTRIDQCQVNFATGETREDILHKITQLSAEMGTHVSRRNGDAWIECR
jgi:poly-gamma-glutamate capsule biosynthesis protein CapA/YwtB (metallophosphatase superfamily)